MRTKTIDLELRSPMIFIFKTPLNIYIFHEWIYLRVKSWEIYKRIEEYLQNLRILVTCKQHDVQFFLTEINFFNFFFFLTANVSIVSFLSIYKFLSSIHFFSFVQQTWIPKRKNSYGSTKKQSKSSKNSCKSFNGQQKNLVLLQQTNQIVQKLLEIFHKKNINFENIQHIIESISKWSGNIKQCNKILHNYTTTLRDRCHRIQDEFNQPQNNLVKD